MTDKAAGKAGEGAPQSSFHDLGLRLATGLVLAAMALLMTILHSASFALLVAMVSAIMCWEWGHIVRRARVDAAFAVHAGAVVLAVALMASGRGALALMALLIGTIAVPPLSVDREPLLSAVGVPYVGLPAIALILLRDDPAYGLAAVLFVLMVVVAVDTGAFFGGRAIGGPKLWPAVSPKKTWAGLVCGVATGVAVALAFAAWLSAPMARLAGVALVIGVAAQAGDLAESALKRAFDVKDSSGLIPGHGGFLDRVDGVVAAAVVAGLLVLLANKSAPGRSLLFGI